MSKQGAAKKAIEIKELSSSEKDSRAALAASLKTQSRRLCLVTLEKLKRDLNWQNVEVGLAEDFHKTGFKIFENGKVVAPLFFANEVWSRWATPVARNMETGEVRLCSRVAL